MPKKQIDFEVSIALLDLVAQLEEMGVEPDEEFIKGCRQTLEGIAIREAAARVWDQPSMRGNFQNVFYWN